MIPVNGGPPMPKHEQRRGGRWGHPLSSNPLSKSESPAGAWGQVPPWQGPWGTPSSLSPSPMCNLSLSPSQLPTLQGLPQFRGFGVQGAVSPLVCAQVAPNPSVIRAMGRDFFFLPWNLPLFFTLPPPWAPASLQMCHQERGLPCSRQPKAVGRGDTAPLSCPILNFNKDLFVTEVWPPAFLLPQVLRCGRI